MFDFKPPYLGAAYYPESWPAEQIDYDLDRLQDHGLNTVRMAEFAWSTMEPQDGAFDFSLFRTVEVAVVNTSHILTKYLT